MCYLFNERKRLQRILPFTAADFELRFKLSTNQWPSRIIPQTTGKMLVEMGAGHPRRLATRQAW